MTLKIKKKRLCQSQVQYKYNAYKTTEEGLGSGETEFTNIYLSLCDYNSNW